MRVVPRVQSKLSRAIRAHHGKKLLHDPKNPENTAMKKERVRFRRSRQKGAMRFVECLGVLQEDMMKGLLWMEALGRSVGSHVAKDLLEG